MKVVSIVGARPQFIKAAVMCRALRKEHTEILVHTGQHYDENMSAVFFDELEIPEPEYSLQIGSGLHGAQTGAMLAAIEQVLIKEQPDWVLVYGDTNSTLAGALAASKLHIRLAHMEAGLRSFNRNMPEEINRIVSDHISDILFCPTQTAVDNLKAEGIERGVHLVGDLMYDSLMWAVDQAKYQPDPLVRLDLQAKGYMLATVHRAENTDDPERMKAICRAFEELAMPIVWPVHPRTRKILQGFIYHPAPNVKLIDPVGYLDMSRLEQGATVILTDSGGIQKEAYWLGIPCVTLRGETEWIETVASGWNKLAGADSDKIKNAVYEFERNNPPKPFLFAMPTGKNIVSLLER